MERFWGCQVGGELGGLLSDGSVCGIQVWGGWRALGIGGGLNIRISGWVGGGSLDLGCFGGLQRRRLLGKCRKGSQGSSWMGANDSRAPGHQGEAP